MNLKSLFLALFAASAAAPIGLAAAEAGSRRWKDDELVASYEELEAGGGLEAAVLSPALPKDPPQTEFLDALAWYAAGAPDRAGVLTLRQLDRQLKRDARSYLGLLKAKAKRGEGNDFARTRTWKLVQKLSLLREEMSKPARSGRYGYPAIRKAAGDPGADAWDREHTLRSPDEFAEKVCRASHARPVLVKYGNTNCTQCMLFEIIGSVKALADNPALKGAVDVYKVWWGYRPDEGFAGRIRDPERLDALAKAEGVKSSPFFIVYRNGSRYPCGDAFPDDRGQDERLLACLKQDFGEAPLSSACVAQGEGPATPRGGR